MEGIRDISFRVEPFTQLTSLEPETAKIGRHFDEPASSRAAWALSTVTSGG